MNKIYKNANFAIVWNSAPESTPLWSQLLTQTTTAPLRLYDVYVNVCERAVNVCCHGDIGTPVNRIPIMAKQTLDLYELFRLVVSKGGLVEVINKKLWREITKGLNLPSSITSAAFTLRTQWVWRHCALAQSWSCVGYIMSWVGSEFFFKFLLGWVETWLRDILTSWNTLLSANEYCSWIIAFIDSWLVECRVNKLIIG